MRWSNYKKLKNYTVFSKQEQTGIFTCNFNLNTIITYLYHGIKLADLKSEESDLQKQNFKFQWLMSHHETGDGF